MADLLDDDIITAFPAVAGGTVALHCTRSSLAAAHLTGMFTHAGTPSQAFAPARRVTGGIVMVAIGGGSQGPFLVQHQLGRTGGPGKIGDRVTVVDHGRGKMLRIWPEPDPAHASGSEPSANQSSPVTVPATNQDWQQQTMSKIAQQAIAAGAAVGVDVPSVPDVDTNEPVSAIRRLFALTWADFAGMFGISERHAHRWRRDGVPEDRRDDVNALLATGLTIIGGLGPIGARRWLAAGDPSGEELVREGSVRDLYQRAVALKDSPFT